MGRCAGIQRGYFLTQKIRNVGRNSMTRSNEKCIQFSMVFIGFTSIRNIEFKKLFAFEKNYSNEKVERMLQRHFPPIKKINFLYFEENGIVVNGNGDLNMLPS